MNDDLLLNRRDFIATATGALAVAGGLQSALQGASAVTTAPAAGGGGGVSGADWFDQPMRWGQLVLAENDPGNYDAGFWLDLFKRMRVDAVCLSAGGCVCFYPTEIPLHYKSAWMKEGMDPFGELVEGCRGMGMRVMARTDPHSIKDDAAAAHPEWVAVDAKGNKRRHWAAAGRWVTCAFGPYNFEFMTTVHQEIVRRYPAVGGIFANRWQGSGMCYCESCKKQFRDFCKRDLPRTSDARDAGYRDYLAWSQGRLFELWGLWEGEIKKINPAAGFVGNAGGGSTSTFDMVRAGKVAPFMVADRQSRRAGMPPWTAGKNAKEFRAVAGDKPVIGLASLAIEDDHRWKDSVINDAELRIWIADGIANGMRPWVGKFGGVVYDARWLPTVEKIYAWHAENEGYLRNVRNLARVGMVYSQQTGMYYGGADKEGRVKNFEMGFYQALVESRVPFEMVHEGLLDAEHVDRFKLLILPNTAAMSDGQCEQIRQYVRRGGSLLATFETSLYDEWGVRRKDFGLADLFGVSASGAVVSDVKNSYMHVEKETGHAILRGLEDAGRIINTTQHVEVRAVAAFGKPPLTRIPSYPDLPMEESYPRVVRTDIPEVFLREMGGSRVAYVPGDLERTFWEVLATDHLALLRNLIAWAVNEEPAATAEGAGMMDVTAWEQRDSMTVHLVNLTNPMMFKPAYREIIASGPQVVSVRVPAGREVRGVKLLVSGKVPEMERVGGVLKVRVEAVGDFEVVGVDFS